MTAFFSYPVFFFVMVSVLFKKNLIASKKDGNLFQKKGRGFVQKGVGVLYRKG